MDSQPLITTVIPTYNRANLLKRAVKSVLNQSYANFQVCIYDNNSQDETPEIATDLEKNDLRIKYYRHEKNIGSFNNFNYGLFHVTTPFFSLLSDDDILLPKFYEVALEGFKQYPQAFFSACDVIEMTENGEFLRSSLSRWSRDGFFYPHEGLLEVLRKEPVWTGILYRKDALDEVGYLDPEIGFPSDVEFTIRVASIYPIFISREPGAIFVDHRSSASSAAYSIDFWKDWVKIIEKLKANEALPLEIRLKGEQILKKRLGGFFFRTRALINKDFESAYKSTNILRNSLNKRSQANLLFVVTYMCEKIHFLCNILKFVRFLYRRIISRLKSNITPKNIKIFRNYLYELNSHK